jgi:hypothetical protein
MEGKAMDPSNLPALGVGSTFLIGLLWIGFGLLNCFFGYRIFRVLLGIYGFLLGAVVGVIVAGNVAAGQTLWMIVGAIVGGIVGAVLMVFLYFVGVFVVGALAGAILANAIGVMVGVNVPTVVVVIVAIAVGVVALIAQRVVIILATAFSGSWAAVAGGALLFTGHSLPGLGVLTRLSTWEQADLPMLILLIAWLVLGIAGALVQFRTTAEGPAPSRRPVAQEPRDRW